MSIRKTSLLLRKHISNLIMKNRLFAFSIISLLLFNSCTEKENKLGDFKLLPTPQEFTVNGASELAPSDVTSYYLQAGLALPKTELSEELSASESQADATLEISISTDLDMNAGGYELEISKDKIRITAKDEAGLLYGFESLEQLMMDANEQQVNLPVCSITDYPLLAYRAIHLDIKHHRETKDYYYKLIDKLAHYKINGIIVEMEDKLKFEQQPVVASADAFTIEEWSKLSDYAKERHIEISPLIQGLGHASFILKHDEYKDLRDDPESDWAFNPLDEKTYEVQFDLYEDAIKATPHGKYLHIGGDEVHTNGRNSGKSALELQLIWLNKVTDFAEKHNRIPIFWDDMPLKNAGVYGPTHNTNFTVEKTDSLWAANGQKLEDFLEQFPKNCIYMRWSYTNPEIYGNKKAMKWFTDNGLQVMGATAGQTRWVLMPQNESNIDPIKSFAVSSIKNNLNGLLLTLWDDDSPHFELFNRGILAFAEYTWSGDKLNKEAIKSLYRQRAFSNKMADSSYAFIDDLEGPVAYWKNALLKGNSRNYISRNEEAKTKVVIDLPDAEAPGKWSEAHQERLVKAKDAFAATEKIAQQIEKAKATAIRNQYTLEIYEQVNKLVQFTTGALLTLEEYDMATDATIKEALAKEVKELPAKFKSLRAELETVYGKTRKLNKPDNYILDQDHHVHLANQSLNFDWQFYAEMLFLEKVSEAFGK